MVKRVFDCCIALLLAVALSPIALLIALSIKVFSGGSVIFWSERLGRHQRPFMMPKFRTMHEAAPVVAAHELIDAAQYVTRLGRMLRRTSLDEIPQLWCVIRGEMSLVGPRPLIVSEAAIHQAREQHGLGELRPGITGWAQINGRNNVNDSEKIALDAEYLARQSFGFDVKILGLTIWAVLTGRGVSH